MVPKITEMYAFVAEESPEDEGLVAFRTLGGEWVPMVGANIDRVKSLKTMAQMISNNTRKKIRLIKFSVREDLETIEPSYIPLKG